MFPDFAATLARSATTGRDPDRVIYAFRIDVDASSIDSADLIQLGPRV